VKAFLLQIFHCFASSSSRLQLFGLLNRYTAEPLFEQHGCVLATHPLMPSILTSLLVDNSTTACTIGLTMLTKLLPIFAVQDCGALKRMLPQLFAILARILCWRERGPPHHLPHHFPKVLHLMGTTVPLKQTILHKRVTGFWIRTQIFNGNALNYRSIRRQHLRLLFGNTSLSCITSSRAISSHFYATLLDTSEIGT
jgi:hypothetical protein